MFVGPLVEERSRSKKTADRCFTRLPGLSGGGGGGRDGWGNFGTIGVLVSGGDVETSGASRGSSETVEGLTLLLAVRGGWNSGFTGVEAGKLPVLSGPCVGRETSSSSACVAPEVLTGLGGRTGGDTSVALPTLTASLGANICSG